MASIFSFKCSCCGELHEGSPSFSFNEPSPYAEQDAHTKEQGTLTEDICTYIDEDGEHFFIRVVLEVPINGVEEPFTWGVWVSLSKESFSDYVENYTTPEVGKAYFGWFCNYLPHYDNTYALASDVVLRGNSLRPCLDLHEKCHELVHDFNNGITIQKAQEIAEKVLHK